MGWLLQQSSADFKSTQRWTLSLSILLHFSLWEICLLNLFYFFICTSWKKYVISSQSGVNNRLCEGKQRHFFHFHFVELLSGVNCSLYEGQFSHFLLSYLFFQVSTTVSVITDLVPFSTIIVLNCLIYLAVITIIIIIIIIVIIVIITIILITTALYCLVFFAMKSLPYYTLSWFCKYVKKCRYHMNWSGEGFFCVGSSEKFTTGTKEDQFAAKKRKKGEERPLHRHHSHSHHSGLRHLPQVFFSSVFYFFCHCLCVFQYRLFQRDIFIPLYEVIFPPCIVSQGCQLSRRRSS